MQKIKDPVLLGIAAGLAGNLLKNLGNEISTALGFSKTTYSEIAGGIYMNKKKTYTPLGKTIGYLADTAIGGALGVGLVYLLKTTGRDHAAIKGVGYSHIAWTVLLGGMNKLGLSSFKPIDPETVLSSYINHTLYGFSAAVVATIIGDKNLFSKEDIQFK
ncbi:MAG: hypothetical protein QHH10_12360 [Peptococcaceae bacterium]|jgi:hypothetical protein|nr:hypothetical protein [Peptococcaceae bacterium]MDH7526096.1 hypothetical protein [Peptococcaceae bacterium]